MLNCCLSRVMTSAYCSVYLMLLYLVKKIQCKNSRLGIQMNNMMNKLNNFLRPTIDNKKALSAKTDKALNIWLRGPDLNQRPSGYEPDELPDCSTPRQTSNST